jgi:hypothetical protein
MLHGLVLHFHTLDITLPSYNQQYHRANVACQFLIMDVAKDGMLAARNGIPLRVANAIQCFEDSGLFTA